MKIGVSTFPTEHTMGPAAFGREAELRGFESVWFPEHSHIPTSRLTPWGGRPGADPMPEHYPWIYEQFVALSAVAASTSQINIGSSICLVPQRDPIWLAKSCATLDVVSDGRFLFGVGYGWNREEVEHHGVPFTDRRDRLREAILAMKQIWLRDEASFNGDHVRFSSIWSRPKPRQSPHPPVIMGAEVGPRTADHIAEFCDGWMPVGGPQIVDQIGSGTRLIREACERRERPFDEIEIGVWVVKPAVQTIEKLAALGVSRSILLVPQVPDDEVLRTLDGYATLL